MTEILNTADIAEAEGLEELDRLETDMSATEEPTGSGIEFHVSMNGYTMSDMEELIVNAAARQILGKFANDRIAKAIEAKCIELLDAKASAALESVTTEIINQPLTPDFGDKNPVTMREFIGLCGREYLMQRVDNDGRPVKSSSWGGSSGYSRIELLVMEGLGRQFRDEIEKARYAAVREVQTAMHSHMSAYLKEQKAKFREALTEVTK